MNNQKIYAKLTQKILTHLENGTVAWQRPWARTPLEAPMNAESGYRYSGGNHIWLSLWTYVNGFSHPLYLTMKQVKQLNKAHDERSIHVRKGEGGYPIIWFNEVEIDDPDGTIDADGNCLKAKRPIARVYYVWNVAQIAGLEAGDLPEYERRSQLEPNAFAFAPLASVDTFVKHWQAIVPIEHGGERAFYRVGSDRICLPYPERFGNRTAYYLTLFHEIVHSTGHETRLNRDLSGAKMEAEYGREELVAEMGAVYLASVLGIEPAFENSVAYIAGWQQACEDDPQLLFWAAKRAGEATDYILNTTGLSIALEPQAA